MRYRMLRVAPAALRRQHADRAAPAGAGSPVARARATGAAAAAEGVGMDQQDRAVSAAAGVAPVGWWLGRAE